MNLLKDKTILITGASRGIGLGILELFVQKQSKKYFVYTYKFIRNRKFY